MSIFWHVYIIRCADNTLYTGITPDLGKRIALHNTGKGAKYTRGRLPVKLLYSEQFSTKSEASKREYELKQLSKQQKLAVIAQTA